MFVKPRTRPFGIVAATLYALKAAILHYRFARTDPRLDVFPEGIGLVVSGRDPTQYESDPTQYEMGTIGSRWSDWSRVQGKQPLDPATPSISVNCFYSVQPTGEESNDPVNASGMSFS